MPQSRNHDEPQNLHDVFDTGEPSPPGDVSEASTSNAEAESVAAADRDDAIELTEATRQRQPSPVGAGLERAAADQAPATLADRLSQGQPSRPLLGVLPLARVIPQDVHSVMDYLDAGAVMTGAALSDCPRARTASLLLGGAGLGVSSLTDYRISLAKVIPIEAHETIDYLFGISAIAAPFALGYRKTAPLAAAMHMAIGVGTIVTSLLTDYRAYRGVGGARTYDQARPVHASTRHVALALAFD